MANQLYQRALRKLDRIPGDVRATPSSEEITLAFAADEAAKKESGQAFSKKMDLRDKRLLRDVALSRERMATEKAITEKGIESKEAMTKRRLAEQGRQFEEDIGLSRDIGESYKAEGRKATFIELGNVGLEGLGSIAKLRQAKKDQEINDLLLSHTQELGKLKQAVYRELFDLLKEKREIFNVSLNKGD